LLKKAQNIPVAVWLDSMSTIPNMTQHLDSALAQQQRDGRPVAITFVVYDLPDRDCAAAASNGELDVKNDGLNKYKQLYIDPIVSVFSRYPSVGRIVAVVEPDSLPNLATNMGVAKCQEAQSAYKEGIAYALQKLSALSNVHIYLDAAHGGWLGWDDNRAKAAAVFKEVLGMAGNPDIRGFITNTANYQGLGCATCSDDPCKLMSQYNKAIDEIHFVQLFSASLESAGITGKKFLIDTSRNGVANMRKDCSNWCNIKGAGLGIRPIANPSQSPLLDALVWIKTPGEADGTSDQSAQRYDYHCGSSDSFIPSPQAGQWNHDYFVMLCQNANPPL